MKQGTYRVVKGDATKIQRQSEVELAYIPHVCNNLGGWGAGFVIALTKAFGDLPMDTYKLDVSNDCLGKVSFALVGDNTIIANMIAQDGYLDGRKNPRPLKYDALVKCMDAVAEDILIKKSLYQVEHDVLHITIHCPKFGSDLAGGNWEFIEELIEDCWLNKGIDVTVYEFVPEGENDEQT
jgi:hypothetical protein